ncbi:unnamed protein product [Orchesella dallaii]|uniref:Uncharacterized protein n=1 Tax=Orchesella dallaii TaxID=48710 RepID=A0ABP1S8F2_9HEXA
MAGRRSQVTSCPAKLLESSYFEFVGLEGRIGAFEVCGETGEVYFSFLYTEVKVRADSLQDILFDDNLRLIRLLLKNNQAALFEFEEDETYFNVKVECELIEEAIKARNQSGRVKDAFIYAAANFLASAADFINEVSGQTLLTVTIPQRVTPSQAGFGQQLAIEPPVRVGGGNQNVGQEMRGGHQNVAQSQAGGGHRNLAQERGGGENQAKRDDDGVGYSNNPNKRGQVLEE